MFSTLVILGASITGLAVARNARRRGLQPVVVDSAAGPGLHSRWVTAVNVGSADDVATIERILHFGSDNAALIATSDHWIRFIIDQRAKLSEAYRIIAHPDNATLQICLDKMAFARWCFEAALPIPGTWMPESQPRPQSLRFPLLMRPVRTEHGRAAEVPKAVQAQDEAELWHWLSQFETKGVSALVSESLLNRSLEQYSVPFARANGRTLLFTARKVRPAAQLCQTGTCVEVCFDERAEQLGRAAVERLDYFGIGEVEILRDTHTGEDFLIEINARPWLQYALAPASNHDFLGLVLGLSPMDATPVRSGKTWIDLHQDLFVAFSRSIGAVRHGQLGLFAYLRSLTRCNVFALFDWRDPGPFFRSLRQ